MSHRPPMQIRLFGGEDPVLPAVVAEAAEEIVAAKPRRDVSAERELLAAQVTIDGLAIEPPEIAGWREEMATLPTRFHFPGGVCERYEERRQDDGTIGPCPYVACPKHLLFDYGEPVRIRGKGYAEIRLNRAGEHPTMGRRPGLAPVHTDGEADAFALDALARLEELPDTCRIDAERRAAIALAEAEDIDMATDVIDAARVGAIADSLGLSEEQIRLDTHSGGERIGVRFVNGQPEPSDPDRAEDILRATAPKPKIRRTWRGKVGKPPPVPRAIVREERAAPPVREASAEQIFTF